MLLHRCDVWFYRYNTRGSLDCKSCVCNKMLKCYSVRLQWNIPANVVPQLVWFGEKNANAQAEKAQSKCDNKPTLENKTATPLSLTVWTSATCGPQSNPTLCSSVITVSIKAWTWTRLQYLCKSCMDDGVFLEEARKRHNGSSAQYQHFMGFPHCNGTPDRCFTLNGKKL